VNTEKKVGPFGYILVLFSSVVGFASSIYLTQHFYEVRGGTGGFKSLCNISATMNCDVVAASKHSEFVAGIPLSAFTTGWFMALFIVAMIVWLASGNLAREAKRAALAMSLVGLCLFCLVVDGANLLALIGALLMKPEKPSPTQMIDWGKWRAFAGTILGCMFVCIVLLKSFDVTPKDAAASEDELVSSILSGPALAVGAGTEYPSMGQAGAPITIVEFSDFQCPYCKMAAVILKSVMDRYPHDVRLVFRNFPLSIECNPSGHNMHPYSCEAARVALCAQAQGKFKEAYEAIFENQEKLAPGAAIKFVTDAGVDPGALSNCLAKSDVGLAIQKDVQEGLQLSVQSTPTLFINGHKIDGAIPLSAWSKLIDQLLKK
jgi:protein-disulfide isomerase